MSIRFFHTADIHFGVENYGRIDPATGIHTRLLDFEKVLSLMVDRAIAEDIDLFVFAGDAYKTAYPSPTQQKLLMNQFFRLQEAGIPLVIVVGNHDHPLSFGRAHALDVFGNIRQNGFVVFSKPQAVTIQTKKGPVQVVGVPWPMRHNVLAKEAHQLKEAQEVTEYLSSRMCEVIRQLASKLTPSIPSLLVGHLTVANGIFSGSERRAVFGTDPLFLPSQLALEPFDYVALGHLHRHQNLHPNSRCPVVYSGSPERVDFGERNEPKGYCDVTVSVNLAEDQFVDKKTTYQFIELPVRPMKQIDITLAPIGDATRQVLAEIEKHDLSGAIVKIVYHVPAGYRDAVDGVAVQKACAAAHYLAGVVPVHAAPVRQQRTGVATTMDISELLTCYFKAREIAPKEQERLQKRAEDVLAAYEKSKEKEQGSEQYDEAE